MEALGNLGRRAVAWLVLGIVAIVLLKIVFGIIAGFVQTVLLVGVLLMACVALVWALNRV
jgi:hypothetical protein